MTMQFRIACLALAIAAAAAGMVHAQKAERPDVHAGDRWRFVSYATVYSETPNRTWVIESVTPDGIEGTENGEPLRLTLDLNVLESPRYRDSNPGVFRFPLVVGKRWRYATDYEFKDNGSKVRLVVDVAVVAHEKVKVVGGEFDAFRIETKGSFRGRSKVGANIVGESVGFIWYAPAARMFVKSVNRNQYRGTVTVELVDFELRG